MSDVGATVSLVVWLIRGDGITLNVAGVGVTESRVVWRM